MNRPKKKTGSASWQARPQTLSEKARVDILGALGLNPNQDDESRQSEAAYPEIEKWLGFYKGGAKAYKNMPRTADYRNSLKRFSADLLFLREKLKGYAEWERNSIEFYAIDLKGLEIELEALAAVSHDAEEIYAEHEPKGRPKDEPRLIVIKHLRRIFESYYKSSSKMLNKKKLLKEKIDAELDFVEVALKDADIPCPENLSKLFKDRMAKPFSIKAIFWPGSPND